MLRSELMIEGRSREEEFWTFHWPVLRRLGWSATEPTRSNFEWLAIILDPKGWECYGFKSAPLRTFRMRGRCLHKFNGIFPMDASFRSDLPEGRRYRVQIGRFLTEPEAQVAVVRLDRIFSLQSFVVRDDG